MRIRISGELRQESHTLGLPPARAARLLEAVPAAADRGDDRAQRAGAARHGQVDSGAGSRPRGDGGGVLLREQPGHHDVVPGVPGAQRPSADEVRQADRLHAVPNPDAILHPPATQSNAARHPPLHQHLVRRRVRLLSVDVTSSSSTLAKNIRMLRGLIFRTIKDQWLNDVPFPRFPHV